MNEIRKGVGKKKKQSNEDTLIMLRCVRHLHGCRVQLKFRKMSEPHKHLGLTSLLVMKVIVILLYVILRCTYIYILTYSIQVYAYST